MLWKVEGDQVTGPTLRKVQVYNVPAVALFSQRICFSGAEGDADGWIEIRYHPPPSPADSTCRDRDWQDDDADAKDGDVLRVPLYPLIENLEPLEITILSSPTTAYRMPDSYGAFFSARLGFEVVMTYIGDGQRAVLGPSFLPSGHKDYHIAFSDAAPYLVTSRASLDDVTARLRESAAVDADGREEMRPVEMDMRKFRPNIVVDGAGEAVWAEDYWAELTILRSYRSDHDGGRETKTDKRLGIIRLALTANCGRCQSINMDYVTGRITRGPLGAVLKLLMRDRRVDTGNRWDPVFGRYGFLLGGDGDGDEFVVSVGDEVRVSRRNEVRSVWDWPHESSAAAGRTTSGPSGTTDAAETIVTKWRDSLARLRVGRSDGGRGALRWLCWHVSQCYSGYCGYGECLVQLMGFAYGDLKPA